MTPPSHTRPAEGDRSWLSAAADGDASALNRAALAWRDDEDVRKAWHAYHLIGDTLRSAEMAHPADRNEAFLQSFRERLAQEPVILAPAPSATGELSPATRRASSRWAVPAAVAAGFVVVAGVLVISRTAEPWDGAAQSRLASASSPSGIVSVSSPERSLSQAETGAVLRDPRVDELLRAHQSVRGGMVLPGSALRRVDNVVAVEPAR
jgi:sigma-E factor negative regulatory protein RseA